MTAMLDDEVAELRRANAELQRRLDERTAELQIRTAERDDSEAQKAAIGEVLEVINSAPGDLTAVFDAMLGKAFYLCDGVQGSLWTFDGGRPRLATARGISAEFVEVLREQWERHVPSQDHPMSRLMRGERVVQILDMATSELYRTRDQAAVAAVELGRVRTVMFVALVRNTAPLGAFIIARREVRPFADKQIALLQNFAAQAVIAMENARLLTETRKALEQQTATAEVLHVINTSPGDLAPVFDAMVDKAMSLCGASIGGIYAYEDASFRAVALRGVPETYANFLNHEPLRPAPNSGLGRIELGERVVHIADVAADRAYGPDNPAGRTLLELGGARSVLLVALTKDERLVGAIFVYRQEVKPFNDKEIALLQNFAAQAVIAMENARLITETREALEQQTATAEVLQVINSSPGDLAPVFQSILEKAHDLCGTDTGRLFTYDGECFRAVAAHGVFAQLFSELRPGCFRPDPGNPFARVLEGAPLVHIADVREVAAQHPDDVGTQTAVEIGVRSFLLVPLRKDNVLLGAITANRREVRPFSDKQIALLQNFAAQAVIAMENARLLTETREALERQTATAEVLQVINSSPGDLAPVFDAMLMKAMRLCDAAFGVLNMHDGEAFWLAAHRGLPHLYYEHLKTGEPYSLGGAHARLAGGADFVHLLDAKDDAAYPTVPSRRALVDLGGARTVLVVPLRKDRTLLGSFALYRQEVRPFSDKQIALLENFAAQAVIAIENARLLNEIRQRQAELRVTFDNMVDGVAMFDAELRLAAWNRNFQELLDLPNDFLSERHGFDEFVRYLTERGEFGETDPDTEISRLRGRLKEHYQFERTRPDGTVIEVRHNPMPDAGVVLIYSDITERKRSEAEIHAARDAAEAAYRDLKAAQASLIQAEKMASLGQLTAGIAHEIKNPLNFVNNFAGLSIELLDELKETAAPAINALGDEKRAEIDETMTMLTGNLEKIAEHGRRADGIVKSMLEHSRGTSGERRSVDLNGLIEEALNLAYHGARAQDASFNITLERDFPEAIAAIQIVSQDITRVCLNLISNGFYAATKRQREGRDSTYEPTLKVSTRNLGDAVEIIIRDNGIGIPPEIKDKLFQPFFTTKPTGEGTGLGLSISYDIVTQQHGGTIQVDSRVGEFTEFTVRLPRTHRATMAEAAS